MEQYMKTTGKSYNSKICKCEKCGELFESDRVHGLYEVIVCPKCCSNEVTIGQRTLATVKEEKEFGVKK